VCSCHETGFDPIAANHGTPHSERKPPVRRRSAAATDFDFGNAGSKICKGGKLYPVWPISLLNRVKIASAKPKAAAKICHQFRLGVHCRLQRVGSATAKSPVSSSPPKKGLMNEHVVDRGAAKVGRVPVHGSDRAGKEDEAAPEPWRQCRPGGHHLSGR